MMVCFAPYISMKGSHDRYDDVVVEVRWVEAVQTFQIVRIRYDKSHGNHKSVVADIIEYIKHGVSETEVGRLPWDSNHSRDSQLTSRTCHASSLIHWFPRGRSQEFFVANPGPLRSGGMKVFSVPSQAQYRLFRLSLKIMLSGLCHHA